MKKSVHGSLDAIYQQALDLYQQGQLAAASKLFQQLSMAASHQIEALHMLAVIAMQNKQPAEAVRLLRKLLSMQPHHAGAMANLGSALKAQGKLDEALLCFDQSIKLLPNAPETFYNRGDTLRSVQRFTEAIDSYQQAIRLRPNYPKAYLNMGNALQSLQRYEEAVTCYQQVIAYQPQFATAYSNCGNALKALGRQAQALQYHDKAVALAPDNVDALMNRANLLFDMQQFADAIEGYQQAMRYAPVQLHWLSQQASAYNQLGRYAEAAQCYRQLIQLQPDNPLWHNLLGNALQEMGELEAAVQSYDQALALKPDYIEVYSNRGIPLYYLQRLDQAMDSFDQAIKLNASFQDVYWNRALALLLKQDYLQGWQQYETRWNGWMKKQRRHFTEPLWLGQFDIAGKTILLHAEQGYGDTLQFCRYASLVAGLRAKVILEVQAPLQPLLNKLAGMQQVIAQGQPLPAFDVHCPLMSLPLAFKTQIDTIPHASAYLSADSNKMAQWQANIHASDKIKVGVVWAASLRANELKIQAWDQRKSIPLKLFADALQDCEVDFYSLQKGEPAESEIKQYLAQYWPAGNFYNLTEQIKDFSDTAALIAHLDLVICVDTSVAHLAAAMGKPTWILNRVDTCWRWLQQRSDSPWYDAVRLYRQPQYRDWQPVLAAVRQDLMALAKQHATTHCAQ